MAASFCLLFGAWVVMLTLKFFVAWFVLPDLVLMVAMVLFFAPPLQPLWRILLPLSLLSDVATGSFLGYHAGFYTVVLLIGYQLRTLWFEASLLVRTILLVVMSCVVQVLRCLLLYLLMDIVAPSGWAWAIVVQCLLFPFVAEWVQFSMRTLDSTRGRTP